ncbi:MAG: ABC transporter transmembrane domain-containing protein [Rhizobiaceae bacterium]
MSTIGYRFDRLGQYSKGTPLPDSEQFEAANRPLDKNLMRYIWRHTKAEQIWILCVILASMPTYFMVLNLPVRIVNEPIQGEGFDTATATMPFLQFSLGLPDFLGGASFEVFSGFELERWPYLIALSMMFLTLVCVNGLFKFYINTYKGRLGERMLRRTRYQLVDRVLRFPIHHFKRVKGSEVASMVKDEVEPFGEFIGDAFVQPVYLGGQALVAFVFILNQSFWLGMIAVAIIAVQMTLIPHLRKKVLILGRMRQVTARMLSGRIGEIVEGITAVHVNDTSNYERSEISSRLGKIFFIRYELYQRKFFIKFLNNFLAQLTPFLFYVVGGYFAIRGSLNVGQLLGVVNAYKDLPSPINGLIQWDQKRTDINIKYAQIVEQFNIDGMTDAEKQAPSSEPVAPLEGEVMVSNLSVTDESGTVLIEDADFALPINGITAAIGPLGSGAGAMANVIGGLMDPTGGRVRLNGKSVTELPQKIRGRRFAYVGSESYLPQLSILDSLLYVNKHAPLRDRDPAELGVTLHPRTEAEAVASGNTLLDYYADWVDYDAMGISGPEEVFPKVKDVMQLVEMDETIYDLAMRQMLSPDETPDLCQKLIDVRQDLRQRIDGSPLAELVEVWDRAKYNEHASIAENLLFGTVFESDSFKVDQMVENEHLRAVLAKSNLDRDLFQMGVELADTAIELFADLSPDNPFFEQLNFMTPEELEEFPPILGRAKQQGFDDATEFDKRMLIQLTFGYIERRNRLRLVDEDLQTRILEARNEFHDTMPDDLQDKINVYDLSTYNALNSVQDNILFGKIAYGLSNATEQVQKFIRELLEEKGLQDDIFSIGLQFDIGTGGKRLSENQRQRITLARSLMKGSDLLIINRGINALDARAQDRLVNKVLERARGDAGHKPFGLLWVLTTPSLAERFDKVMVFERQRLLQMDSPEKLASENSTYQNLIA